MTSTDLEPVTGEIERTSALLPTMSADGARRAMDRYQELCAAVLRDDDWIGRPGEPDSFVKKTGWTKLQTYYGVSTELLGDAKLERDADGNLLRASARARAIAMDGRHADGGGACGRNEPRFQSARGRQKIEHDLPATAETRATNRAIANLIGFGAVSAEEVDADVRGNRAASLPDWAADVLEVGDVADRFGTALEAILGAAGVADSMAALDVANRLVRYCDGTLPAAAARLARLLAQAIPQTAPPTAAAEPEPEADEPPADATPDEPPEGENE